MRELIDRDDAIEAVETLCRKHQDILNKQLARRQSHESHALYSEGLRDGCEVVIAALRSLPAAEKGEGQWNKLRAYVQRREKAATIADYQDAMIDVLSEMNRIEKHHDTSGDAAQST